MKKILKQIDGLKIYGNNHDRELLNGWELSEKWNKELLNEFDYLASDETLTDSEKLESIKDNFTGFIYKNELFSLSDFMRNSDNKISDFCDGIMNFTYFSGLMVKIGDTGESLKVYNYFSS